MLLTKLKKSKDLSKKSKKFGKNSPSTPLRACPEEIEGMKKAKAEEPEFGRKKWDSNRFPFGALRFASCLRYGLPLAALRSK